LVKSLKMNFRPDINARLENKSMADDYFKLMMMKSPVRDISLTICITNVIIVPLILYSIIWYDKFGSDKRRTFINMLVSLLCWSSIEFCFVIQCTEIIRYIYGPLPKLFCFFKSVARGAYTTEALLYFDAMCLTKYIFIFWLKNPAAFQDKFWTIFLYIWIKGVTIITNFVFYILAGHQMISYYICTGIDPTEDFKKPFKLYGIVEVGSIFLNVAVLVRIFVYKNSKPIKNCQRSILFKNIFLLEIKKQSLASFSTNFINISGLTMLTVSSTYLSSLKPHEIPNHATYLLLNYLVFPGFSAICFATAYYVRHEPLRKTVFAELKDLFRKHFVDKSTRTCTC